MKTKLLKRLRNNYSLIEYKKQNEKPYYIWHFKYKKHLDVLCFLFLPITLIIGFLMVAFTLDISMFFYYQSSLSNVSTFDKNAVFNEFREKRISQFVRQKAEKRRDKRVKTKKVWY